MVKKPQHKQTGKPRQQYDFGKLTRSSNNAILGGVCAGLSDFFNVDVSLVRLIFALLVVFGGSGFLLYIILWIILPSDKSTPGITEENIKLNAQEIKKTASHIAQKFEVASRRENSKRMFGVILLFLGFGFLMANFGIFSFNWLGKLWPLILIFIAFSILSNGGRK